VRTNVEDEGMGMHQKCERSCHRFSGFLGFVKGVHAKIADIAWQAFSTMEAIIVELRFCPIRRKRRWIAI
jgi:hypothetical protein